MRVVCICLRLKAVFQQDTAVKDEVVCRAVLIVHAEVSDAHELIAGSRPCAAAFALCIKLLCVFNQSGFDLAALQHRQRFRIDAVKEVFIGAVRLRIGEEILIQTDFRIDAGGSINPVNGSTLDLAPVGRISAATVGIVFGIDLNDVAVFILLTAGCGNEVSAFQTHLVAGVHPLVFGNRSF